MVLDDAALAAHDRVIHLQLTSRTPWQELDLDEPLTIAGSPGLREGKRILVFQLGMIIMRLSGLPPRKQASMFQ
jgi:hypothetical protein